jgi:hypothetical protein
MRVLKQHKAEVTLQCVLKTGKPTGRLKMTEVQIEYPPLTLDELNGLLSRHVGNVAVAKVITDAMHRRLAQTEPEAS